jgi:hypothetical protein
VGLKELVCFDKEPELQERTKKPRKNQEIKEKKKKKQERNQYKS